MLVPQVDYAAAGIFLNVTSDSEGGDSAPWWQLEGGSMAPGLEPLTPVRPPTSLELESATLQSLQLQEVVADNRRLARAALYSSSLHTDRAYRQQQACMSEVALKCEDALPRLHSGGRLVLCLTLSNCI